MKLLGKFEWFVISGMFLLLLYRIGDVSYIPFPLDYIATVSLFIIAVYNGIGMFQELIKDFPSE